MSHKPIIAYEFSTFVEGEPLRDGDILLGKDTFSYLWDFILSNNSNENSDAVMSISKRGRNRCIKANKYVGTIQTRNGQVIEILPKIYKQGGQTNDDQKTCREVFLNMLKHFTDIKARSFQSTSLNTKENFPILEVYISNYINAVEQLILGGLRKDYAVVEENQNYLKGKLDISKQITKNVANKAVFAIRYNKYIENIPQNRVVATTLRKLLNDSHSTTNKAHISGLLTLLSDIPSSNNIENDLRIAESSNRLFSSYDVLIKWSSQFLLNKGFTTFSGSCVNQSLLFQADKLFEKFIAYLFKKHASSYNVDAQNKKYYLIDRHKGRPKFQLIPDILVESDTDNSNYECIIVDTKWKNIDSAKKSYLIEDADLYQLYAYGQKYRQGYAKKLGYDVIPKLVLLYPYSEKFTESLPEFVYEDIKEKYGLKLMVVPFDLSDPKTYKSQVHSIIHCLDAKPGDQPIYKYEYHEEDDTIPMAAETMQSYSDSWTMLVGCYKNQKHLEWITKNNLYNVRVGDRKGAVDKSGLIVSASRLLLYDVNNPEDYSVFKLDESKQIFASYDYMKSKDYPELEPNREYLLYVIKEAIESKPNYDIEEMKKLHAPNLKTQGAPFYVTF